MIDYRLGNHPSGSVTLPSGRWKWFAIRICSLPDNVCHSQNLIFAGEDRTGSVMRTRIPPEVDVANEKEITEYGRMPDEREFQTQRGRYTIYPPRVFDANHMWMVRPESGRTFRTNIASDRQLGELTDEELEFIERQAH
jgi:hypothetical protein